MLQKLLHKQDIILTFHQIKLGFQNHMEAMRLSCFNNQAQICAILKNLKLNKSKYDFDF